MEHHRRLGIAPQVRDAQPAARPADRRELLHPPHRLGAGRIRMPSEAEKRRTVANSAADRPGARAAPARQPDVRRAFLLEHARSAAEHHRPLRLEVDRFQEDDDGRRPCEADGCREARARLGARNISSAATADEASCAVRWRCAITASPSSTRRTTAAA